MESKTGINQGGGNWTQPKSSMSVAPNLATPTGRHHPPGRRPIKTVKSLKPKTKKIKF